MDRYRKRVRYQVYDVARCSSRAKTPWPPCWATAGIAATSATGGFQSYGKTPALLAQLEVTYADGSVERIVTDASWKVHASPIALLRFHAGRIVRRPAGAARLGRARAGRRRVGGGHCPRRAAAGRWMARWWSRSASTGRAEPKSIREPKPGCWTFDLGQNMVGVVRLKVSAPAGTKITLRHAEMLNPDGTLYTANLRGAPVDRHLYLQGRRRRGLAAAIHLPRLPLRRTDRLARRAGSTTR